MGSLLLLPLSLLLLALLARVHGQFPSACPLNIKPRVRSRCCPAWSEDGSECGSLSGRGRCVAGPASDPSYVDERMNYPWELYSHVCFCNFPFGGYNCGGCTYNRHWPPNCSTTCNPVRKPFTHLTPGEISAFRSTLTRAKSTWSPWCSILLEEGPSENPTYRMVPASIYDCLASAHAFISKDIKGTGYDMVHEGPAFLSWHRWFLMIYEQMLQEVSGNCSMAIPYWDWRYSGDLTPFTFPAWKIHCGDSFNSYCRMPVNANERSDLIREMGVHESRLPTAQDVANTMKWTTVDRSPYDSSSQTCFRNVLEGFMNSNDGVSSGLGMHNQVHVYTGGDMLSTMTATSDPAFFGHHCMIDCILDAWIVQNRANPQTYPQCPYEGHHPTDYFVCSFPPMRNMDMFYPLSTYGSSCYYARPLQ